MEIGNIPGCGQANPLLLAAIHCRAPYGEGDTQVSVGLPLSGIVL
jgi:hypothetical protein